MKRQPRNAANIQMRRLLRRPASSERKDYHKLMPDIATDIDQLSIDTLRILAVDTVQKANSGHPGAPARLLAHRLPALPQAHEAQPGQLQVVQPRPLRALQRPRLGADLRHALSLRLQAHARRPEELPPVGIEDPRSSRVPPHRRRRSHHRAAGPGLRHVGRPGHRGEASRRDLQPARLRDRQSPHLRHHGRWRQHGRRLPRGRLARRNPRPGQADLLLRRQPHLPRRPHRAQLHRECLRPLRGLRLAGAARP